MLSKLFMPLLFGGFALLYTYSVWNMTFRETALPFLAIVLILLLCGVVVVRDWLAARGRTTPDTHVDWRTVAAKYWPPAATVVLMCAYVYATPHVGFYVSTFVFLVTTSMLKSISIKSLPKIAVIMLAVTVFSYFFFTMALRIYLP